MNTTPHPETRHWCCGKDGSCFPGRSHNATCGRKHPTQKDMTCARLQGHPGSHEGYAFSITSPEPWDA